MSLPRDCSSCVQAKRQESLEIIGPRLWKILPAETYLMDDLRTSKRSLTDWCLESPDRSPVANAETVSLISVFRLSCYAGPELDDPATLRRNVSRHKKEGVSKT